MEKKNVGYYSNPLEDYMIRKEEREPIEKEILARLTPKKIEIVEMRFGFVGEKPLSVEEIAKQLCVTRAYVYATLREAFRVIRNSVLKSRKNIVDEQTGMTEEQLFRIADSMASNLEYLAMYSNDLRERHLILEAWLRKVIMKDLTTEERQFLLWSEFSIYGKNKDEQFYEVVYKIEQKILDLLLKTPDITEQINYQLKSKK